MEGFNFGCFFNSFSGVSLKGFKMAVLVVYNITVWFNTYFTLRRYRFPKFGWFYSKIFREIT